MSFRIEPKLFCGITLVWSHRRKVYVSPHDPAEYLYHNRISAQQEINAEGLGDQAQVVHTHETIPPDRKAPVINGDNEPPGNPFPAVMMGEFDEGPWPEPE